MISMKIFITEVLYSSGFPHIYFSLSMTYLVDDREEDIQNMTL